MGEQCGRCWHNHITGCGAICQCACHNNNFTWGINTTTAGPIYDGTTANTTISVSST